jgi:transcriptional regulator with XRE-family HTH domain
MTGWHGMDVEHDTAQTLARAVRRKRMARAWTIDHLASRAGVSKGAVVAVENGGANPSLSTITRLADALAVPITELLGGDEPDRVRVVAHRAIAPLWESEAGGRAILIHTTPGPSPVELWEWTLAAHERYRGTPHPPGTIETVTVQEGALELTVAGQAYSVATGATVAFHADCGHAYLALDQGATFLMTVHLRDVGHP